MRFHPQSLLPNSYFSFSSPQIIRETQTCNQIPQRTASRLPSDTNTNRSQPFLVRAPRLSCRMLLREPATFLANASIACGHSSRIVTGYRPDNSKGQYRWRLLVRWREGRGWTTTWRHRARTRTHNPHSPSKLTFPSCLRFFVLDHSHPPPPPLVYYVEHCRVPSKSIFPRTADGALLRRVLAMVCMSKELCLGRVRRTAGNRRAFSSLTRRP